MTPSTTPPAPPNPPTTLRWVASLMSTAVYAAEILARGLPLREAALSPELVDASRDLRGWVAAVAAPHAAVWTHVAGLSATLEDPYALGAEVCTLLEPPVDAKAAAQLGETLARLKQATRAAFPDLVPELAVRARPLREQWESRGPGLLRVVEGLIGAGARPAKAEVLLVEPLLGGGGQAVLPYQRCLFEAVLTNRHPLLAEPVRLGWLLAQLAGAQQPTAIAPGRYPLVLQLALIPPVLQAAEEVEWTQYSPETIRLALAEWHVPTLPNRPAHEWLIHWWEAVRNERLTWAAALRRMDEWLG